MSDSVFRCFACMQPISYAQAVCPHCGHDNHVRDNGPGYLPQLVLQNQYLVGKMLGHGGFGVTYLGYDLILDRVVAIKEYFPRDFAMRDSQSVSLSAYSDHAADFKSGCQRALRESQMAAGLGQIPNVVSVHNAVIANNTVYIIMEYIDGETLSSYVRKNGGKLPLAQALRLLTPIASALEALHERGVIHRDVKPDNIMVRRGTDSTVLLDFGAARVLDTKTMSVGSLVYTPGYAPPEQYSSVAVMDARVDQYAFCATLYFALTGQTPTDCQLRLYNSMELPSVCTLNDSVSPAAEAVILRGMSVRAENRYPNMAELMGALRNPVAGPGTNTGAGTKTKPDSEPQPSARPNPQPRTEPQSRPQPTPRPQPRPEPQPQPKPEPKSGRSMNPAIIAAIALLAGCGFLLKSLPDNSESRASVQTTANAVSYSASASKQQSGSSQSNDSDIFQTKSLTDGQVVISGIKPFFYGKELTIPSSIGGDKVSGIGYMAFYDATSIEKVTIPNVTYIDSSAFAGCTSLTQVSISDYVTRICANAFAGCTSLTSIRLPANLHSLGSPSFFGSSGNPFKGCTSLAEIIIPDKLKNVVFKDGFLIQNSNTLVGYFKPGSQKASIPDGITEIMGGAFSNCTSLAQVSIPNSVTSIGEYAFSGCTSLTQVSIPDSVTEINGSAFKRCSSLTQVSIPDSVTEIGEGAFENCSPDLTLLVSPGSYAERWAKENGIAYKTN